MYRSLRDLLILLLLATALVPFARWFWVAELASHFRFQYAVGALVLCIGFLQVKKKRLALLSAALLVYHAFFILPFLPIPGSDGFSGQRFTLVQFNVNTSNKNIDDIVEWLVQQKFDIVLLQELSPALAAKLDSIKDVYAYQIANPQTHNFGAALISRKPFAKSEILPLADGWNHYIRAEIALNDQETLHLYGVHTLPPMSAANADIRNKQLEEVARIVGQDKAANVVLVGDLNLTPYSPYFGKLLKETSLTNSMLGMGTGQSWPSMLPTDLLRLPIDHVLVSEGMLTLRRQIGPSFGSDHLAVISELATKRVHD